jgi:uncharacterized protein YpmB
MPTTSTAELYFIAGAFVLIIVICVVAVYVFVRQYKREKSQQERGENRSSVGTGGKEEEE